MNGGCFMHNDERSWSDKQLEEEATRLLAQELALMEQAVPLFENSMKSGLSLEQRTALHTAIEQLQARQTQVYAGFLRIQAEHQRRKDRPESKPSSPMHVIAPDKA